MGVTGCGRNRVGPTAPTRLGDRLLFLPQGWGQLARHSPRLDLGTPPSAAGCCRHTPPEYRLPPPARSRLRGRVCAQLKRRRYLDLNACPKRTFSNLSAYQIDAAKSNSVLIARLMRPTTTRRPKPAKNGGFLPSARGWKQTAEQQLQPRDQEKPSREAWGQQFLLPNLLC